MAAPVRHAFAYVHGDGPRCRVPCAQNIKESMELEPVTVAQFILQHLPIPKDSPESIVENIIKWIGVANNPAKFYQDAGDYELRARRRNARQNVRRLLSRHPALVPMVAKLMGEDADAEQAVEVRRAV